MKQIYDLQETIAQDKVVVERMEKRLRSAQQMLDVHTEALNRLLTVPNLASKHSPSLQGKVAEKPPVQTRERITLENWKELGIEVGDKVEIVVSGDEDYETKEYVIDNTEDLTYNGDMFLRIVDAGWYYYNCNEDGRDELYLIRTEEGSLGKV